LSNRQQHRRRDGRATTCVFVEQGGVIHLRGDKHNGSLALDGGFGGPHGLSADRLAVSLPNARWRVHLVGTHVAVHVDDVRIPTVAVDVARGLLEQLAVRTREETNECDGGKVGYMAHSHGEIHVE